MTERPILFSAPMVRAILDGRKTQTRRVIKPKRGSPIDFVGGGPVGGPDWNDPSCWGFEDHNTAVWWLIRSDGDDSQQIPCPYGQSGDRLWVRETWQHSNHPLGPYDEDCAVFYRADYMDDPHGPDGEKSPEGKYRDWRPSIHMPRAACRLVLEVTGVRVERLNDCSEADAVAEGLHILPASGRYVVNHGEQYFGLADHDPRVVYADLWDRINGAGAWESNPWVWAIEFQRISSC